MRTTKVLPELRWSYCTQSRQSCTGRPPYRGRRWDAAAACKMMIGEHAEEKAGTQRFLQLQASEHAPIESCMCLNVKGYKGRLSVRLIAEPIGHVSKLQMPSLRLAHQQARRHAFGTVLYFPSLSLSARSPLGPKGDRVVIDGCGAKDKLTGNARAPPWWLQLRDNPNSHPWSGAKLSEGGFGSCNELCITESLQRK